jgi:predicted transcriptional regulator
VNLDRNGSETNPDWVSPFDPALSDENSEKFREYIQQGLSDIENGRVVPHEEVMCWLETRTAERQHFKP